MEKDYLKKCVELQMSINDISKQCGKSKTAVRYWLSKFELKTDNKSFKDGGSRVEYGDKKKCPCCKKDKIIKEFYDRRGKKGGSVYCIECSNNESKNRFRNFKQKCVEYKGGCCEKCGYSKYIGALQFHHLNPIEKDFALSEVKSHKFNEKIKQELDKCILVCANCHFEIHGSMV
jgi:hypothetical protein